MGVSYPVITGDYTVEQAVWRRTEIVAGTALVKPTPLVEKRDPSLGETGPEWAPIVREEAPA